jgi:hypothetical protein
MLQEKCNPEKTLEANFTNLRQLMFAVRVSENFSRRVKEKLG